MTKADLATTRTLFSTDPPLDGGRHYGHGETARSEGARGQPARLMVNSCINCGRVFGDAVIDYHQSPSTQPGSIHMEKELASGPRACSAQPREILSATGTDSPDSHRPTDTLTGWSVCGPIWSSSWSVGHGGSDILGRSSSPPLQKHFSYANRWMKRMGLVKSLVRKGGADYGGCNGREELAHIGTSHHV